MDFEQRELFAQQQFDPLSDLLDLSGKPATIIISCGKEKGAKTTTARQIYTSDRFQTACKIAEKFQAQFYILSGLHGLLRPEEVVSPYDFNLDNGDEQYKSKWRNKLAAQLGLAEVGKKICVLATGSYSKELLGVVESQQISKKIVAPLQSLDEFSRYEWQRQALRISNRYHDLKLLYGLILKCRESGRVFALSEIVKKRIPSKGVYVFIDPSERNLLGSFGRIVRIGTHAVSEGSKATLKSRLLNHLGTKDGYGNHRGSIFRLHVGRALIEKHGGNKKLQSWGEGQHANSEIIAKEKEHEARVSNYIKGLEVFVLEIDDKPSKFSMRAIVERQLIALCSENMQPIDCIPKTWLGRCSPMKPIIKSGLWNIRDVGQEYDPLSQGSIDDIISKDFDQWLF